MLINQIVTTLTPALSLKGRGRKTNPHSLLSTFVSSPNPGTKPELVLLR